MQEINTVYLQDEMKLDDLGNVMVVKLEVENGKVNDILVAQASRSIVLNKVEDMETLAASLVKVADRARAIVAAQKAANSANVKKPR